MINTHHHCHILAVFGNSLLSPPSVHTMHEQNDADHHHSNRNGRQWPSNLAGRAQSCSARRQAQGLQSVARGGQLGRASVAQGAAVEACSAVLNVVVGIELSNTNKHTHARTRAVQHRQSAQTDNHHVTCRCRPFSATQCKRVMSTNTHTHTHTYTHTHMLQKHTNA